MTKKVRIMNQKVNGLETNSLNFINLFILFFLISGCGVFEKVKTLIPNDPIIKKTITEKKSVSITCNRGDIQLYIDKGWSVVDKKEDEVPCSWKTKRATKRCNIDLDKGCRITIPDKFGKEIIYSLEREKEL